MSDIENQGRKITSSSFAACERCEWHGKAKRNVMTEIHQHVLEVHLEPAMAVYPGENPYEAAKWFAFDIGIHHQIKRWVLSPGIRAAILERRKVYEDEVEE